MRGLFLLPEGCGLGRFALEAFLAHALLGLAQAGLRLFPFPQLFFFAPGDFLQDRAEGRVLRFHRPQCLCQRAEFHAKLMGHTEDLVFQPRQRREAFRQSDRFHDRLVSLIRQSGAGREIGLRGGETFAPTDQAGANGPAMMGGEVLFRLLALSEFPGQLVQTGAADSHRRLDLAGIRSRPVQLDAAADVIQRRRQPEQWSTNGVQIQFRL